MLLIGAAPTEPVVVPTPTFPKDSILSEIQKRGRVRVGAMLDLPDFSCLDSRRGIVTGLEADLARAIARHLFGVSERRSDEYVEFVELSGATQFEDVLVERHVDLVLANYADTPERRRKVGFAGHHLSSSHAPILGPETPTVHSLRELNGLRIAVGEGSTDVDSLLLVAPGAELVECRSATLCVDAVVNGRAEAYWTTRANAGGLIRLGNGRLREAGVCSGTLERWAVGIPKDEDMLGAFVDDVVSKTLESGLVTAWLKRSFRPSTGMRFESRVTHTGDGSPGAYLSRTQNLSSSRDVARRRSTETQR